jgi:ATP-dependent RNA helicase SUPV3L1/SUV3
MGYPRPAPQAPRLMDHEDDRDDRDDDKLLKELGLAAEARLVKMEGRVFVRFPAWSRNPACGCLTSWCRPGRAGQAEQMAQAGCRRQAQTAARTRHRRGAGRTAASTCAALSRHRRPVRRRADGPAPFPGQLAEWKPRSRPAFVFERIRQRIEHAIERDRKSATPRAPARASTWPSIPIRSRWRAAAAPFIALLGPTNSGKTHRAMEALAKAKSGVYLAPLRLLALENFERLQAMRARMARSCA